MLSHGDFGYWGVRHLPQMGQENGRRLTKVEKCGRQVNKAFSRRGVVALA
jgi:hypothetical protein